LRSDLLNLIGEEKKTTVFITHSVTEAAELAERILVFGKPGRLISEIKAKEILASGSTHSDVAAAIRQGLKAARSLQTLPPLSKAG
jgi:NitT/TauT family transport system ATP-binding protein